MIPKDSLKRDIGITARVWLRVMPLVQVRVRWTDSLNTSFSRTIRS